METQMRHKLVITLHGCLWFTAIVNGSLPIAGIGRDQELVSGSEQGREVLQRRLAQHQSPTADSNATFELNSTNSHKSNSDQMLNSTHRQDVKNQFSSNRNELSRALNSIHRRASQELDADQQVDSSQLESNGHGQLNSSLGASVRQQLNKTQQESSQQVDSSHQLDSKPYLNSSHQFQSSSRESNHQIGTNDQLESPHQLISSQRLNEGGKNNSTQLTQVNAPSEETSASIGQLKRTTVVIIMWVIAIVLITIATVMYYAQRKARPYFVKSPWHKRRTNIQRLNRRSRHAVLASKPRRGTFIWTALTRFRPRENNHPKTST